MTGWIASYTRCVHPNEILWASVAELINKIQFTFINRAGKEENGECAGKIISCQ